jgi:dolichyl-phosphate-mannose--protein O-mannosyl transferase
MARKRASQDEEFLASLADGSLYSMGAFFSDQHPELVDEVIAQAAGIEQRGLRGYAEEAGMSVEEAYETLMTGLAVRYYKAVAG